MPKSTTTRTSEPPRYLVFSDLDGTLLDSDTYSYKAAIPALRHLKQACIPLIICTSKTRVEIEEFRKAIRNTDPFISENGGAIFIPKAYFDFKFSYTKLKDGYKVIELGIPYLHLLEMLAKIKKLGFEIIGFNEMSVEEVSIETGLSQHAAALAKTREYDEPIKLRKCNEEQFISIIKQHGLQYTKGKRFSHITGKNDKGQAVKLVKELYEKQYRTKIPTVGLGDAENDFPMLDSVDYQILIEHKDGTFASKKYIHEPEPGPLGWCNEIERLLNTHQH